MGRPRVRQLPPEARPPHALTAPSRPHVPLTPSSPRLAHGFEPSPPAPLPEVSNHRCQAAKPREGGRPSLSGCEASGRRATIAVRLRSLGKAGDHRCQARLFLTRANSRKTRASNFAGREAGPGGGASSAGSGEAAHCPDTTSQHCPDTISQHCPDTISQHCPDTISQHCPDTISQHCPDTISQHSTPGREGQRPRCDQPT